MHCVECPATDAPAPIDHGVAGASAKAEYDRRVAKRDERIAEEWGAGLVAKVVRKVTPQPQSTRAWAIGAAGEEELARVLATVPGLQVLNDRRVPGTKGNIDHIVIAPAGVFVVDAKNHRGVVAVKDRGPFWRTDERLTVGGRDCSKLADNMAWQVEAVTAALHGLTPVPPVTPILCFVSADWPIRRPPNEFRDVRLESPRSIKKIVSGTATLDDATIDATAAILAAALPSK
jgi:hypothetical protein